MTTKYYIAAVCGIFSLLFPIEADAQTPTRTKQQVEELIQTEGKKAPDWWQETKLDYPPTLNLDFPEGDPSNDSWDNQRKVGCYIWDIVNPNPHRWRSGIRLFHVLLQRHANDPQKRNQVMRDLGHMYFRFEQDYVRAAYWWQLTNAANLPPGVLLHQAECYWKLGNKQMAMDKIKEIRHPSFFPTVKLLADMGEITAALQMSERIAKSDPLIGNFYAGDTCRISGRNKEALEYYQKALAAPRREHENTMFRSRAEANILGLKAFELLDLKSVPDGIYKSDSFGYEGPIHVSVTVKLGRITEVRVTEHREKQFYTSITDTTRKIIATQGVKGVDATSGATITSEAIINATAKALAEAMRK
jgi:uncharacterized protein with FMN-binding domain